MLTRHRIHQEIFFYGCLLLAFFLPVFPRLVPTIIFLILVNWLISGIYLKTIRLFLIEKWRLHILSFAALYLLYCIGMLYSTNLTYGWFDLEVKLSMFIFPLVFATSDLSTVTRSRFRLIPLSFVAGCIIGSLVLIVHATMGYFTTGVKDLFYYVHFAWYFHSSYIAMYYIFGIGITLSYLWEIVGKKNIYKTLFVCFILLYLEGMVFLLSSKAGLLTLVITQLSFLVILLFRNVGPVKVSAIALAMIAIFLGFSQLFPFAFKRISHANSMVSSTKNIKTNPNDGTIARKEITKVSLELIQQHFVFGVGTGDVKDSYLEQYKDRSLLPLLKNKLNAHNQYFQTWIAVGFTGVVLLFLYLVVPAYKAMKKGHLLYVLLLVLFGINLFFEAMLETQAGVVFYAFFNVLLFPVYWEEK
jgi:O-antigen ligase